MSKSLCVISGYLIGSINPAYIFSRIKGYDIRKKGTGNAGATNLALQSGIGCGIAALLLDMLKAFLATYLPLKTGKTAFVAAASGIASIAGHIFPFYMGFRGGKGTACVVGFGLALRPKLCVPLVLISMLIAKLVGASTLVPVFAAAIMALCYAIFEHSLWMALLMLLLTVILLIPRRQDIFRLRSSKSQKGQAKDQSLWVSPLKLKEEYARRSPKPVVQREKEEN